MLGQRLKQSGVTPSMNMTPLIDVTFQLIIFFMLASHIVRQESVNMVVPRLERPQVHALEEVHRITVNLAPMAYDPAHGDRSENPLAFPGTLRFIRVGLEQYQPHQLKQVQQTLRQARERDPQIQVLVRADAALHYDQVAPVLHAIEAAGIRSVDMVVQDRQGAASGGER